MSNLTAGQLAAFTSGQPVRQVWSIRTPVLADHSAYTTTVIDDGLYSSAATPLRRVVKAGSRQHKVWNPHPMDDARPEAVRYSIEVDNGDGYFHRKTGSPWNPFGIYDASPMECFLLHSLYVWDAATGAWSPITHMDFVGRVMAVDYSGAGSLIRREVSPGVTGPGLASNTATITSEQVGAWETLRRVFNKDDGDRTVVDTFTTRGTALTTTSISPTTRAHGGAAFTLTVNGTGFLTSTEVHIDGSPRVTTYVGTTQMTAAMLAADIVTAGTRSITAYQPGAGGATSNAQTLTVT